MTFFLFWIKRGMYIVLKIVIFKFLHIMKGIGAPIGEL